MNSSLLDDALSRVPQHTLYHYTTQSGLLGILQDKEIWATHIRYLNDTAEYKHALGLITRIILKRRDAATGDVRRVLEDMAEAMTQVPTFNVCVCSFSEDRDSLSQWRAYCGQTSGYAIGFNPHNLVDIAKREKFYLARCVYDPKERSALMDALVDRVVEQNARRLQGNEELLREDPGFLNGVVLLQGGDLFAELNRFAPILKDENFHDEREWRMISPPLPCTNPRFKYRQGMSMLLPYYGVPICFEDGKLQLDEVVTGPTPHVDEAKLAVVSLLRKIEPANVPVNQSSVPYRSW